MPIRSESFWISFHEWDGSGRKDMGWHGQLRAALGSGAIRSMDRKFETSFWNNLKWLVLYLLAIPSGFVHRAVPEPDSHEASGSIQVAVLFPVCDQLRLLWVWYSQLALPPPRRTAERSTCGIFGAESGQHPGRPDAWRPTALSQRACGRRLPIA